MKKAIHLVNISEAKTHLSKLVDQAAKGEPFVITKFGKPLVQSKCDRYPSSITGAAIRLHERTDRRSRGFRYDGRFRLRVIHPA